MSRSRSKPWRLLVLAPVLSVGCAMGNEDRRLVLNHLDANYAPESATGRWLAAPVALPVSLVAFAADAVVVHPVSQVDDAWGDTVEALWTFDTSSGFRSALVTPLSALATPVVLPTCWLFRSVFDVDDRVDEDDDRAEVQR